MTFIEFVISLNYVSVGISALGFFVGLYYYKSLNAVHKNITWYLLGMFTVDIASRFLKINGNNVLVLLVYSLLEMSFFIFFYFNFLFKAKHRLVLSLYLIAFIYIVWEIMLFESSNIKGFQTYTKVVDDFIIIILALSFFHEKINIYRESKWDNFRLNTVFLVFFSLNMMFFLPFNFLLFESTGVKFFFWFGISISTLLFYLYLTHSIWKNGRTQKLLLSGLR